MTWILENEDGNTREFDSREEAKETKAELEGLGATLELREETDEDDDIDAEVIDMSDENYGGNENSDSDDDDSKDELTVVGDGGRPYTFCRNCDRLSACTYRCAGCGADLAGESHYDGELP